jgi:hypothetical protein
MGDGFHSEKTTSPKRMIENVRHETLEGMAKTAQNRREHGFHPIDAFEYASPDNAPEGVIRDFAESELCVFSGGFGVDRREENQEYIEFLEDIVEE